MHSFANGRSFRAGSARTPPARRTTIFTAMFMHGGWLHLGGNMLYLWIFGDNVEDEFGPVKFLIFYLACGVAATFAQYYVSTRSNIPNVGASGAIAGVLGGYLLLFPGARVRVLVYNQITRCRRLWCSASGSCCKCSAGSGRLPPPAQTEETGGVAFMAHVGGFVAGFLITLILRGTSGRSQVG